MAFFKDVSVDLFNHCYSIVIGPNLLSDSSFFNDLPRASTALIVTNQVVGPLYSDALYKSLQVHFSRVLLWSMPAGEKFKDLAHLNKIFDFLLESGCDRKTILFALGGGVVGDITGFAAACYMRGIPFVQVPTTLLAQVDSSVGGKTGVNHALGKNMIGAFYQPLRVIADTQTLSTLPKREISAGLAEVIKYGPIADIDFFLWLEEHLDKVQDLDHESLIYAIEKSCQIKAAIVSSDEKETGRRAILNFGHTFGHAIEAGVGYGHWLHGEAVGCGMVMAADLSWRLGLIDASYRERLEHLIIRAGLPVFAPKLGAERYLELMRLDKKSVGGNIRFVVIQSTGEADLIAAPDNLVTEVIDNRCR